MFAQEQPPAGGFHEGPGLCRDGLGPVLRPGLGGEQEQQGNILLIYPQDILPIGRTEQDETKMRRVYAKGRETGESMLPTIQAFIKKSK